MSDSTTPWTVAHRAPLYMEFSRQEDWSGLPFLSPGDLPDPGIETRSLELQADSLSRDKGTPKNLDKEGCSHTRWKAQHKLWDLFLKKKKIIYLTALGLSCGMQDLSCGMWDLVPWPGIRLGPPALEARSFRHRTTTEVPVWALYLSAKMCSRPNAHSHLAEWGHQKTAYEAALPPIKILKH